MEEGANLPNGSFSNITVSQYMLTLNPGTLPTGMGVSVLVTMPNG